MVSIVPLLQEVVFPEKVGIHNGMVVLIVGEIGVVAMPIMGKAVPEIPEEVIANR